MTGFDISIRLLAIAVRRSELEAIIHNAEAELQSLTSEERALDIRQQQISIDITDDQHQASLDYQADYIASTINLTPCPD